MNKLLLVVILLFAAGCNSNIDNALNCPSGVFDAGKGFVLILPCDLKYLGEYEEAGSTWSRGYENVQKAVVEISVSNPSRGPGTPPITQYSTRSLRYDGFVRTDSRDLLVVGTGHGTDVPDGALIFGRLRDGNIMGIFLEGRSPYDEVVAPIFDSISLQNTDGEDIRNYYTSGAGYTLCPVSDDYIIIDDGAASRAFYDWSGFLLGLQTGAPIISHNAFNFDGEWFITPTETMLSIYVDIASEATALTLVTKSVSTCADFALSDGSEWSTCFGSDIIGAIPIGATVYLFNDEGTDWLMEASTGATTPIF